MQTRYTEFVTRLILVYDMNRIALIIIILAVLALGVWYAASRASVPVPPAPETSTDILLPAPENDAAVPEDIAAASTDGAPVSAYTVRYGADGFSPATVTVPLGTTVTFVDQSGRSMWVASDEHPSHTQYAGTSRGAHCADGQPSATAFDQCAAGQTYTFTFTKKGTWGYHNHVSAQHKGTVVVE
jgi:plastocyanin